MENKNEAKAAFEEFAKIKLENHLEELSVRYQNKEIDKETKQQAYNAHKKMYEEELNDKIKVIHLDEKSGGLEAELQHLKTEYISKLNWN